MVKIGVITILAALTAAVPVPQQPSQSATPGSQTSKPANGLILGRVVDAASGRGVLERL